MVGREEESGPDTDQISSPATLRVKWQEDEEGLRLVCGEVGWGVPAHSLGVHIWLKEN